MRIWREQESTTEDTLKTVSQKALIHNIPEALWRDEAIGRIASALGNPLDARVRKSSHPHLPPALEVCVVVNRNFDYLSNLRIRLEGNEGVPRRDTIINIEYEQRVPYCSHRGGFGHWIHKCRGRDTMRSGKWAQTISAVEAPAIKPKANSGNRDPANLEKFQNPKFQNPNSKSKKLRTRSHRRRHVRLEYRPVQKVHPPSKENLLEANKSLWFLSPSTNPAQVEPADIALQKNDIVPSSISEPRPINDPITPRRETQSSTRNSSVPELGATRVDENLLSLNQIEGHRISTEDRRGRDHILYNLPNLNSLPRRSSASMSYLNASQRKTCQIKDNGQATEEEEIQSRLRAIEERIASVPILTFNRFQVLQRGPLRKGALVVAASSL